MHKPFSKLGATVFAVVAAAHLLRALMGSEVLVEGTMIPISVSVVAAILAGALAALIWREATS